MKNPYWHTQLRRITVPALILRALHASVVLENQLLKKQHRDAEDTERTGPENEMNRTASHLQVAAPGPATWIN
jgi:hypothetical protein